MEERGQKLWFFSNIREIIIFFFVYYFMIAHESKISMLFISHTWKDIMSVILRTFHGRL